MNARINDHDLTVMVDRAASGAVDGAATFHGTPTWDSLDAGRKNEIRETALPFIFHGAQALAELGYRKPKVITTAEEIRDLPALTVVMHDDMATGGPLQAFVVPDDGTVMFKDCEEFHLLTFGGDYIDAKDMPLPLTVVYEVGA